jgi:hypothetical protein
MFCVRIPLFVAVYIYTNFPFKILLRINLAQDCVRIKLSSYISEYFTFLSGRVCNVYFIVSVQAVTGPSIEGEQSLFLSFLCSYPIMMLRCLSSNFALYCCIYE